MPQGYGLVNIGIHRDVQRIKDTDLRDLSSSSESLMVAMKTRVKGHRSSSTISSSFHI